MKRRTLLQSLPALALLPGAGWNVFPRENSEPQEKAGSAKGTTVVYELRVYHAYEGKLDDLLARFRNHTMALFEKHGIRNVAYWTPLDDPLKGKTLIYIVAHPSREAAAANWKAFQDDPEWQSVRDKSEANGKLVKKVESTYLALTDFSPPLK
jgi:NIPSNAP protein